MGKGKLPTFCGNGERLTPFYALGNGSDRIQYYLGEVIHALIHYLCQ